MEDTINFFAKYTGQTYESMVADMMTNEAHDDIQSDIVDELMDDIESAQLITWEHDSDGDRPNYENLREWLKDYYTLEKK